MEPRTPAVPPTGEATPPAETPPAETPLEATPQADGVDLLTMALLVFFVSLIAIVGLMLFLPAVV